MQVPLIVRIHAVKLQKRGTTRRGTVGQQVAGHSQAVQHPAYMVQACIIVAH